MGEGAAPAEKKGARLGGGTTHGDEVSSEIGVDGVQRWWRIILRRFFQKYTSYVTYAHHACNHLLSFFSATRRSFVGVERVVWGIACSLAFPAFHNNEEVATLRHHEDSAQHVFPRLASFSSKQHVEDIVRHGNAGDALTRAGRYLLDGSALSCTIQHLEHNNTTFHISFGRVCLSLPGGTAVTLLRGALTGHYCWCCCRRR